MPTLLVHAGDRLRGHLGSLRRDGVLTAYGALAAILTAFVSYRVARGPGQQSAWIDGWGVDAFELVAGSLCMLARRRRGSAAPLVLGAALIAWGLGDLVLSVETLNGSAAPSPSVADIFYLAFFPLSYVAAVLFIRGETRRLSSPNWLDGTIAGLGAATVLSAFAFKAIAHSANLTGLATAVNLAYPVGDVMLLLLVVGGTAVLSNRRKGPWILLALGFAINMLGDTFNLMHQTVGSTWAGTFIDAVAWPTSSLLLSAAMWLRPGVADPLAPTKASGFLLPGLAACAGLTVLSLSSVMHVDRVATVLSVATLGLVMLRTAVSVRELRVLNRRRHRQSVTDHLTGLPNRRRLFEALAAAFAEPEGERPSFAFLFIDLNGFKRISPG